MNIYIVYIIKNAKNQLRIKLSTRKGNKILFILWTPMKRKKLATTNIIIKIIIQIILIIIIMCWKGPRGVKSLIPALKL